MRKTRKSRPADDSVSSSLIKPVSIEQIEAVAKFLPIFENINPEDFSRSVRLPGQEDVAYRVGQVEFHPAVYRFIQACYENGFVQPYDWSAWAKQVRRYMANSAHADTATLTTCIRLLTGHIRYERFCDGHLHSMFESGHLTAILRRLNVLASRLPNKSERRTSGPDFRQSLAVTSGNLFQSTTKRKTQNYSSKCDLASAIDMARSQYRFSQHLTL